MLQHKLQVICGPMDWFVFWGQLFDCNTSFRLFAPSCCLICLLATAVLLQHKLFAVLLIDLSIGDSFFASIGDSCSATAQASGFLRSYWLISKWFVYWRQLFCCSTSFWRSYWLICLLATAFLLQHKLQAFCGPIDWFQNDLSIGDSCYVAAQAFWAPTDWFVYWRRLFSVYWRQLFCLQHKLQLRPYWLMLAAKASGYLRSYWLICLSATALLLQHKIQVICCPIDWSVYWWQMFCYSTSFRLFAVLLIDFKMICLLATAVLL